MNLFKIAKEYFTNKYLFTLNRLGVVKGNLLSKSIGVNTLHALKQNINGIAKLSDTEDVFICEHGIKQIQNLHKFEIYSDFAEKLKKIIKKPDAKVLNMQYFIKHPEYKITSPHQDGAYFFSPDKNIITFWIPLDIQGVDESTSCLHYLIKQPKFNHVIHHRPIGNKVRTRTGTTGVSQYTDEYELNSFSAMPMKFGEFLIHDQFALHYASENKTLYKRTAITCIMEI